MTLTWLDWLFIGLLTVTTLAGFLRGLVREALGLASWIVALLAARWLAEPVAELLSGLIDSPDGRLVLAAFGAAKGAAILVLATIVISLTPLVQLQAWQQAMLRPSFEQMRDWAVSRLAVWEDRLPESAPSLGDLPRSASRPATDADEVASP